jgi:hypothetical protein
MVLKPNSILNELPPQIGTKTLLIFDSLRFNLQVIDECWTTLLELLRKYSSKEISKNLPLLFHYVWSIVDNTQRFVKIYELLPSESNGKILEPLKCVQPFRHTFEHLDQRIDEAFLKVRFPFWGSLTWVYKNVETQKMQTFITISGINYGTKHEGTVHVYNDSAEIISGIQLESVKRNGERIQLRIDKLMDSLNQIVDSLEIHLEAQIENNNLKRMDWEYHKDLSLILQE